MDVTGLPFVFASQSLEGSVPEDAKATFDDGGTAIVDQTRPGPRRSLMPARNGVFSYDLSSTQRWTGRLAHARCTRVAGKSVSEAIANGHAGTDESCRR